jgi:hypothetical protein
VTSQPRSGEEIAAIAAALLAQADDPPPVTAVQTPVWARAGRAYGSEAPELPRRRGAVRVL